MGKNKIYDICLGAMMIVIMILFSQAVIAIGPVPFNLGVMGAFLMGLFLRPRRAFLAMLCYILMGAFGLPVFAGLSGGPGVLFGLTGGYILGYIFICVISSLAEHRGLPLPLKAGVMILSLIVCYAFGTAWFMFISRNGLYESLTACVIPFILPDLMKLFLALWLSGLIKKSLKL